MLGLFVPAFANKIKTVFSQGMIISAYTLIHTRLQYITNNMTVRNDIHVNTWTSHSGLM